MSREIFHKIFVPGGNDTSFVFGTDFSLEERKNINDLIMRQNPNVEQVGFLGGKDSPELIMAGGEFCGNATRSAAFYYLDGRDGQMTLKVNGKDYIQAGVRDSLAWCQIPLSVSGKIVEQIETGIYKVNMEGMTSIVIKEKQAKKYLENKENIKIEAMNIIKKYDLLSSEAVGVMFLEKQENLIKMHPVVWVNAIDTLFYETACGSGTTATAIVESYINNTSKSIDVLQPSGYVINASITMERGSITKAVISGKVMTDNVKRKVELD